MALSLLEALNNREKALFAWLFVILIFLLFKRATRDSLLQVLKAFLDPKLLRVFAIVVGYILLVVYVLHTTALWNASLMKDTIYWFLFTAFVLFVNLTNTTKDENYFRKLLFDTLKFYVVIEYVINYFTFSFWVEFTLVPLFFLIGILRIIADRKEEFLVIKRMINGLLGGFGIFLILYVSVNLLNHFQELLTLENLQAFLFPLLLTLAYMPLLYILGLFMAYQDLFVRLNVFLSRRDAALAKFAKRKILMLCHVNLRKIIQFNNSKSRELSRLYSKEDVSKLIDEFKTEKLSSQTQKT